MDQPVVMKAQTADTPAAYCENLVNLQSLFLRDNQALLATGSTPVPAVGTNLFTFLANRLSMSFTNLDCRSFGLANPVTVTLNGAGAASAAAINATAQAVTSTAGTAGAANPVARPSPSVARTRPACDRNSPLED